MVTVKTAYPELPTTPAATAKGYFYFIKADKGLWIADRMVQTQISAVSLNRKNYLQGSAQGEKLYRCLSRAEWLKYLVNNDLNGTVVKNDNSVWHCENFASDAYLGLYKNKSGTAVLYNFSNAWTLTLYAELNQDIQRSNVMVQFAYAYPIDFSITTVTCRVNNSDKDTRGYLGVVFPASTAQFVCPGSFKQVTNVSFRPVMEYIDHPKSKSIWY